MEISIIASDDDGMCVNKLSSSWEWDWECEWCWKPIPNGPGTWYRLLYLQGFLVIDNLLLDHVGLPGVLDLAVNLVIFLSWWFGGIIPRHSYN